MSGPNLAETKQLPYLFIEFVSNEIFRAINGNHGTQSECQRHKEYEFINISGVVVGMAVSFG
jgi:hypothetical protein